MRVLVLAIASPGAAYDAMKAVTTRHARSCTCMDLDLVFVYGRPAAGWPRGAEPRGPHDVVVDVEDNSYAGAVRKTVAVLAQKQGTFDFCVRANLSQWFHWDRLHAFLSTAPARKLAAGRTDQLTYLSGCDLVMSPDVCDAVEASLRDVPDSDTYEDQTITDAIYAYLKQAPATGPVWMPRLDVYCDEPPTSRMLLHVVKSESVNAEAGSVYAVRCKSASNRQLDVDFMDHLTMRYAAGDRDLIQMALSGSGATAVRCTGPSPCSAETRERWSVVRP